MVSCKWEKQVKMKDKSTGFDGSKGINRSRKVRMYIVLYIKESSGKDPRVFISKATAGTVIATENLRQGRLMADHGGLYSNTCTKLR
jgi:hypothetical protein